MKKQDFSIKIEGIPQKIKHMGFCVASDRITKDGLKVGYMYREAPFDEEDSGWRFLAGDETEEYVADAINGKIFDVNIIANHDTAIIPYLSLSVNTELERINDSFVEI